MRRVVAICLALSVPTKTLAENAMLDCAVVSDAFVEVVSTAGITPVLSEITAEDGWCIANAVVVGDVAAFTVRWRGVIDSTTSKFDVEIGSLQVAGQDFAVTANAQYASGSRQLTLTEFTARADAGHGVNATGAFILGSSDPLALRIAEAAIDQLSAQVFVNKAVLADLGLDAGDIATSDVSDALAGVNFGQVSRQSQRELLRFVGALPDAQGRLDVAISTPQVVEITKLTVPFIRISGDEIPQALGRALDGVQVDLRWNPGRM